MKQIKNMLLVMAAIASMAVTTSCSDDGDAHSITSALVTVKDDGSGKAYFQVDDHTIVKPNNISGMPFGNKEVRALTQYEVVEGSEVTTGNVRTLEAKVYWVDSVLTKKPVPTKGSQAADAEFYGNDAFTITNSWMTVAEDGYVNLQLLSSWGMSGKIHYINLVQDVNSDDPYEFRLCQNSNGDTYERLGYSVVAFNIKDIIAATGKQPTQITINYTSQRGESSVKLPYGSYVATSARSFNQGDNAVAMQ